MCLKKDKGRDLRIMKSMKKVFGALLTLVDRRTNLSKEIEKQITENYLNIQLLV